jgi:hypothetical protein
LTLRKDESCPSGKKNLVTLKKIWQIVPMALIDQGNEAFQQFTFPHHGSDAGSLKPGWQIERGINKAQLKSLGLDRVAPCYRPSYEHLSDYVAGCRVALNCEMPNSMKSMGHRCL